VYLVGFIIRTYHDARSSECQKSSILLLTLPNPRTHSGDWCTTRRLWNKVPLCKEPERCTQAASPSSTR